MLVKLEDEDDPLPEEKVQAMHDWFSNICKSEFSLIDGLVALFVDKYKDAERAGKLLKVLKKLNEHYGNLVGP